MGRSRLPSRRAVVEALLVGAVGGGRVALAQGPQPLVVVVATGSPLKQMTLANLRALFLGEPIRDEQGHELVPLNQPAGTPDRVAFDRLVLGMTPDEVGRYWVDRRIRGQGHPPRSFGPVPLLLRLVGRFPAGVTYARANDVGAGVRILPVDGKRPGDRGYPLVG